MPFSQLGAFGDAAADANDQDKDSTSDVQRFIFFLNDLSDIFISDIFMASIDWLGTYLLDLLGTFDLIKKKTNHQHHVSARVSDLITGWSGPAG